MKALLLASEIEDYTIAFANGVARHLPVVLAVPRRQYGHLVRWLEPDVDVRLMDWPRHRSPANLGFLAALTRLVRRIDPDVVHLLSNNTLWLPLAVPFWRPIPLVTTVHDVKVHPGDRDTAILPSWTTTLIVRQSAHVVVHGEGLKRLAMDRFAKPASRVHVLPHPALPRYAELARSERLQRRPSGFNVLFFGRVFAYKGLDLLVRAEAALGGRIPGLRVVIAGRGDDPWSLKALMGCPARYDVRSRFIEDVEVAQLFLDADVVVLPYAEASQSGVLNLAATFGKPVVATAVGELQATVEAHGIGLTVPPHDPASLGAAIAELADRPELRARLGANALAWSTGTNAPEAVGAMAERLYRTVVRPGVTNTQPVDATGCA